MMKVSIHFPLLAALCLVSVAAGGVERVEAGTFDWVKAREKAEAANGRQGLGQYFTLKGGGFFPEISVDGHKTHFDVGTGAEIGYGLKPLPYVAVEATIGYYEADHISDHPDYFHDPVYLLSVVPMSLTAKLIAPVGFAEIYALGGAGMHYLIAKKRYAATASNTPVLDVDDDDVTTGFHYGGGVALNLGSASLGIEVRRIEGVKSTIVGNSFDISGTCLYGAITMGF